MLRGQCAYTAQSAWIRNLSLRDNILMGRPLYQARYDAVIKACALEQDLRALPAGNVASLAVKKSATDGNVQSPLARVFSDPMMRQDRVEWGY